MTLCINPHCPNPQNLDNQVYCLNCGSELLLQGRYRVVKRLGGGGFGKTYEVVSEVKSEAVLRNGLPNSLGKVLKILTNDHPKAVELFQREADVLSMLNHPGIPHVDEGGYFIYFPRNGQQPVHCLIMEKIEGVDLREYLRQRNYQPIDEQLAISWLRELTSILQQVHEQNFFHRDIKPANIMLRNDGRLTLIDFGTVREVSESFFLKQERAELTGVISTGYTPHEQINGQGVQQSDFFALGRTFVFLLTGKEPNQLYDPQTDILEWRHQTRGISNNFLDFLDFMMGRLPHQRPQSTEFILKKLPDIEGGSSINMQSKIPDTLIINTDIDEPTVIENPVKTIVEREIQTQVTNNNLVKDSIFFYQWILATLIGVGVGLLGRSLVNALIYAFIGNNVGIRHAIITALVSFAPVEFFQWLVLRRRITWDFWSLLEQALAILLGLAVGSVVGRLLFDSLGQLLGALIGVMMFSAIAKTLLLKRQSYRFMIWLSVSLLGIVLSFGIGTILGVGAYIFLSRYIGQALNMGLSFSLAIGIAIFLFGVITGRSLMWLLQNPIRVLKN
jgi:serine/threonine protein kinase